MLAIAFSNDEYSDAERRMILHVVRITKMDRSVFLEMEQLIKTAISIKKEHIWVQTLYKPYAEVRPIVDELEKRQKVLVESAMALIEDETEVDEPYVEDEKRRVFDDAKIIIGEKVAPIASEIKAGASKLFGEIKAKVQKKDDAATEVLKDNEDIAATEVCEEE